MSRLGPEGGRVSEAADARGVEAEALDREGLRDGLLRHVTWARISQLEQVKFQNSEILFQISKCPRILKFPLEDIPAFIFLEKYNLRNSDKNFIKIEQKMANIAQETLELRR